MITLGILGSLIVFLVVVALIYWIIVSLPLPPFVSTLATIILVVFAVLYLLKSVGLSF